jgi:hypothetical protein
MPPLTSGSNNRQSKKPAWKQEANSAEDSTCNLLSRWFLAWLIVWPWRLRRYVFSETTVGFQRTVRNYVPEDRTLHYYLCENQNSYLVELYPRFGRSFCLILQESFLPWRWRQQVILKRRKTTRLYVTPRKIKIFTVTAVRTSNPTSLNHSGWETHSTKQSSFRESYYRTASKEITRVLWK